MQESSSSTKKWLIGCGIGCGVILVIGILFVAGAFFFVRNLVEGFQDSDAILQTLTERYGRVSEYCPEPDGIIEANRIEAFLAVREATASTRQKIEQSIAVLSDEEWEGKIDVESSGNVFTKIKLGLGLIPQIAEFLKVRNQALLDADMGMGEYYYLYTLVYFSWLKKPVVDGPPIQIMGDEDEFRFEDWEDEEAQELRQDMIRRRLHRMTLPMLRNQYEKLMELPDSTERQAWQQILKAELDALESDRYRLAWEEGLPETMATSLEPFRVRLNTSYSPMMNAIEISIEQR